METTTAIKVNGKRFRIVYGSIEKGTMTLQGPRGGEAVMVKDLTGNGWHLNRMVAGWQLRSVVVESFELITLN